MRTVTEIHDRIRGLLFEELQRRAARAERRLPDRCVHHRLHPLDSRPLVEGEPNDTRNRVTQAPGLPVSQTIGLCMHGAEDPESWPGDLCEDVIDAQRCPKFTPIQSKEQILAEFKQQLDDPEWIRANMPEVYALLWVLDTQSSYSQIPWWVRLWWWLLRIRLEPVKSYHDLTRHLPATTEVSDGVHGP